VELLPTAAQSVRRWLYHLGGLGLIPLGLLDNSPIPLPGAMDVATILLCLRQEQLRAYYWLMATAGSVILITLHADVMVTRLPSALRGRDRKTHDLAGVQDAYQTLRFVQRTPPTLSKERGWSRDHEQKHFQP
jgi:hypothetical protein